MRPPGQTDSPYVPKSYKDRREYNRLYHAAYHAANRDALNKLRRRRRKAKR